VRSSVCFSKLVCQHVFPDLNIQPVGFAVVGMAALLTGVVRAPLTGIVLVIEMTASVTMLLPMLGACFVAMLVPTLLRDAPVYDSLRELILRREKGHETLRPRFSLAACRRRSSRGLLSSIRPASSRCRRVGIDDLHFPPSILL
jgi:hypothetical protein